MSVNISKAIEKLLKIYDKWKALVDDDKTFEIDDIGTICEMGAILNGVRGNKKSETPTGQKCIHYKEQCHTTINCYDIDGKICVDYKEAD